MKNLKKPLEVEIVDGVLVISIGAGTLAFAAQYVFDEQALAWADNSLFAPVKVVDPLQFAYGVLRELNREEEDGSTRVTRLLDKAFEEAADQGCEGLEDRS